MIRLTRKDGDGVQRYGLFLTGKMGKPFKIKSCMVASQKWAVLSLMKNRKDEKTSDEQTLRQKCRKYKMQREKNGKWHDIVAATVFDYNFWQELTPGAAIYDVTPPNEICSKTPALPLYITASLIIHKKES